MVCFAQSRSDGFSRVGRCMGPVWSVLLKTALTGSHGLIVAWHAKSWSKRHTGCPFKTPSYDCFPIETPASFFFPFFFSDDLQDQKVGILEELTHANAEFISPVRELVLRAAGLSRHEQGGAREGRGWTSHERLTTEIMPENAKI